MRRDLIRTAALPLGILFVGGWFTLEAGVFAEEVRHHPHLVMGVLILGVLLLAVWLMIWRSENATSEVSPKREEGSFNQVTSSSIERDNLGHQYSANRDINLIQNAPPVEPPPPKADKRPPNLVFGIPERALVEQQEIEWHPDNSTPLWVLPIENQPSAPPPSVTFHGRNIYANLRFLGDYGTSHMNRTVDRACWLHHTENQIYFPTATSKYVVLGEFKDNVWFSYKNDNRLPLPPQTAPFFEPTRCVGLPLPLDVHVTLYSDNPEMWLDEAWYRIEPTGTSEVSIKRLRI